MDGKKKWPSALGFLSSHGERVTNGYETCGRCVTTQFVIIEYAFGKKKKLQFHWDDNDTTDDTPTSHSVLSW